MTDKNTRFTLNNGAEMPAIGLGVFQCSPEDTVRAVQTALGTGYRLIDTAAAYRNEEFVGEALRASGLAPSEIFITSKLWISDYGYDEALRGYETSLAKLGLETLDLYLLHQPLTAHFERTLAAYKALAKVLADGRVRAIGVSNMNEQQIEAVIAATGVVPAVNQVEVHPFFAQGALGAFHAGLGITTMAWSPIGGINRYRPQNAQRSGDSLQHPVIVDLAARYGKTPAQVVLRWHVQNGVVAIPKSVNPGRIAENIDVYDFFLSPEEMAAIEALDTGVRGGPDPASIGA
jgi:diketogulonate reductase-like aldo/keto reductase